MRYFIAFFLFLNVSIAYAQRKPGNESEFTIEDIFSKRQITLQLNDYWFRQSNNLHFRTEDNVDLTCTGALPAVENFEKTLQTITKGEKTILGLQKWERLGTSTILKAVTLSHKNDSETAMLNYAVYTNDGKVIMFMILLEQRQLDEWEPYFDFVATTVKLLPPTLAKP